MLWAASESLTIVYPYVEGLDWALHLNEIKDLPEEEYLLHVLNVMVRASQAAAVLESEDLSNWDLHAQNLIITPNEDLCFIDYLRMSESFVGQLVVMFLQALRAKEIVGSASLKAPTFHFSEERHSNNLIQDIVARNYPKSTDTLSVLEMKFAQTYQALEKEFLEQKARSETRTEPKIKPGFILGLPRKKARF